MHIAYLINRYPAASHSFIRREIEALERAGIFVSRFTVRPVQMGQLPDIRDQTELTKTVAILAAGALALIGNSGRYFVLHPRRSLTGLRITFARAEWRPLELVRRAAYFAEAAFLARQVRTSGIQHIHAHFGTNSATVARIAAALSGVPYSFTAHGPDEFDAPRGLDLAGKIRDCAFCVAISSFGRSQLMRWSTFADWKKIRLVRCGVDSNFLDQSRLEHARKEPNFCSIARLSAQKGVPLLLEAAAELKRRGHTFKLTIVGDGEMRSDVEATISALDLNDHVILSGMAPSEAVIAQLQNSRAMILPSFAEGLPVVIMEALALGTPVIVTAIAGTPELVDDACGWLVPAGSIERLVAAMECALEASAEQLSVMGDIGRARVEKYHNSILNGFELAEIFREVQRK